MSTPNEEQHHALAASPTPGRPGIDVRSESLEGPSDTSVTRRTALKLVSATALFASGALGCTRKPERLIVSLHDMPEYQKPGVPLFYASTYTDGPVPYGMMVKAVDGRPIKVEGLPGHPLNDGTSDAWMQASMLSLYDPERLRAPTSGDTEEVTWDVVDPQVSTALRQAGKVLLVTRSNLGPSERALIGAFDKALGGKLSWRVHEPAGDLPRRKAWQRLTGEDGAFVADLSEADVVLSLECDFLGTDGAALTAAGQFATRRKVDGDPEAKNVLRLYAAEGPMTLTGANADHRIPLRTGRMLAMVEALRAAHGGNATALASFAEQAHVERATLEALAKDLDKGAVVLAGAHLPPAVHAAVLLLNQDLGAFKNGILAYEPDAPLVPSTAAEITSDLEAAPDVVLFLGVNPIYDTPALAAALSKAKLVVAHGLTKNETLEVAHIALPSAHNLESWNDATPTSGVRALCQPQIAPLFDGRQEAASLFLWARAVGADLAGAETWPAWLEARWNKALPAGTTWAMALQKGLVGERARAGLPAIDTAKARALIDAAPKATDEGFDLVLLPHPAVYDGRFAGNAWLQELPDPVSKLVWDAAAAVHPATARTLKVKEGDWIEVTVEGRAVSLPVLIQAGTDRDVVAMSLGQGRTTGAGLGNDVGTSAAALLNATPTPRLSTGVTVTRDGSRKAYPLVRSQDTFSQHDRHVARQGTVAAYRKDPAFARHEVHVPPLKQLDDEWDYSKGRKWAMAIDLSACTGCNACVIACQAENNISVVGKDEVQNNREMHWIRVDRYETADEDNPDIIHQPMLCQQCDNAPCENVCPVNATSHSPEGLNDQAYNRCVGTRYCGNNCPYKVRRFNYLAYNRKFVTAPVQELLFNPQVTVRSRGIMEKCTFCVQRINTEKFKADNEDRPVKDADLLTACQQSCPAGAVVFGDVNDKESLVASGRASDLAYHVLEELNVRPNVSYLAKVTNPNPGLTVEPEAGAHEAGGHHDGGQG